MTTKADKEFFWQRVDKSGECWLWTGWISKRGYGEYSIGGKSKLVHRIAYEWLRSKIPEGFHLHHKCDASACVNPAHLRPMAPGAHLRLHGKRKSK